MWRWCPLFLSIVSAVQCPNSGIANRTSIKLALNGIWKEVSGVALSTQTFNGEGLVWVHDDSGGVAALGLFSIVSGLLVQRFDLPSSPVIPFQDPEDIALGDCGASWPLAGSGECIYLADVGDNSRVRDNVRIYKMREPTVAGLVAGGTSSFVLEQMQILRFVYDINMGAPTLRADCETIFVDSVGQEPGEAKGDVYLVTKWINSADFAKTRVFRYPNSMQNGLANVSLQMISDAPSLREAAWTRGDMTRDGSLVVIGGYGTTRVWQRGSGVTIAAMFNASALCSSAGLSPPLDQQIQQEAAGFTPTAPYDLLEMGECNAAAICNASLYHTPLRTITTAPSLAPTAAPTTAPPSNPVNHASQLAVASTLGICAMFFFLH